MLSFQPSTSSTASNNNNATQSGPSNNHQNQQQQQEQQQSSLPTMRLRDDPAPRPNRKRKTPPTNAEQTKNTPQPPQPQQPAVQMLPPPHALMQPLSHMQGPPAGYSYSPADYTPGGMPPQIVHQHTDSQSQSPPPNTPAGRALSSSKRAEQNRKAQRAFRERRDQFVSPIYPRLAIKLTCTARHVKALESRSQLLDAALASADEANRRWEECRALVDQLRVENTALRAALSQAQMLSGGAAATNNNGAHHDQEGLVKKSEGSNEPKNDPAAEDQSGTS